MIVGICVCICGFLASTTNIFNIAILIYLPLKKGSGSSVAFSLYVTLLTSIFHANRENIQFWQFCFSMDMSQNILGKQGMAVPTHAKFISPCVTQELINRLSGITSPNPFNTDFICGYASQATLMEHGQSRPCSVSLRFSRSSKSRNSS